MTHYTTGECIAIGVIFAVLPIPFVVLRFIHRLRHKGSGGWSDIMVIPALLGTWVLCGAQIVAAVHGRLGLHVTLTGVHDNHAAATTVLEKCLWTIATFDKISNGFVKLSALFLYRQIFKADRTFRILNTLVLVLVVLWIVVFFPLIINLCSPPSIFWTTNRILVTEKCWSYANAFTATVVTDFLTDLMVLSLPIRPLMKLEMSRRQKIALGGTFMLGGFVLVTGGIRIWSVTRINTDVQNRNRDVSYWSTEAMFWSSIHASIGVVSVCLPTLRSYGQNIAESMRGARKKMATLLGSGSQASGHTQSTSVNDLTLSPMTSRSKYDVSKFHTIELPHYEV